MAGELLLATLRHVWAALTALQLDMALMGGIAVAAWHHLRNTRDVDLLVAVEPAQLANVLQQLAGAGIRPIHDPPLIRIGESSIVQLSYAPPGRFMDVRVDLFLAETEFHQSALARRVAIDLPGLDLPVFILSCEDLILFKLSAGRLLDRADCAHLLRENREAIDVNYLKAWTSKQQLADSLREVWREAYGVAMAPPM